MTSMSEQEEGENKSKQTRKFLFGYELDDNIRVTYMLPYLSLIDLTVLDTTLCVNKKEYHCYQRLLSSYHIPSVLKYTHHYFDSIVWMMKKRLVLKRPEQRQRERVENTTTNTNTSTNNVKLLYSNISPKEHIQEIEMKTTTTNPHTNTNTNTNFSKKQYTEVEMNTTQRERKREVP